MDPAEVEFIAERESIQIVPKFNAGTIFLLQGDYGPFKAGLTVKVGMKVCASLLRLHTYLVSCINSCFYVNHFIFSAQNKK
jgi:hypothetical protein